MVEISKPERVYRQESCGGAYPLRDGKPPPHRQGRGRIGIGPRFYGDQPAGSPIGLPSA